MAQSHDNIVKIVADTAATAKVDLIGDVPCIAVSGDVGCGFFCTPASIDDLAWLGHAAPASRAGLLLGAMRMAMQKAQGALKAHDKKNKITNDNAAEKTAERLAVAQKTFAGALNGTLETSYQDGSMVVKEAERQFIESKVRPWAVSKGKNTDPDSLDNFRKAIAASNESSYKKAIEELTAKIVESRTYEVSRKGGSTVSKDETGDFSF